tara:strand:+ start:178 stop:501 length:324 start_codon:yes stop_codon:yes gene_type:complete
MFLRKNIFVLVSLLFIFSCNDNTELSDQIKMLKSEQSLILKKQNEMLVLLDKISKMDLASSNKKNNNKKQQPLPADPNFVHNIPVGNSIVLGNPNAPVTIMKFTDFQ